MQARGRIEKTKLWSIVKRMPKGALLHCHLEALIDVGWLLDKLFAKGGFHIAAAAPLSDAESLAQEEIHFRWRKAKATPTSSIWAGSYNANDLVPLEEAADSFPKGGRRGFIEWIRSRASITHEESLRHHDGPNAIWQKFLSCFRVVGSMISHEVIWSAAIQEILRTLVEDRISYVDFRAVFREPFYREQSETPEPDNRYKIQLMDEALLDFMESEAGKSFWGARLIWTDARRLDTKAIIPNMKEVIQLKQEFPELIAGYDLVSQEDLGRPLVDLLPELFWFKKACAQAGVDIPFYFHAGETLGDGDATDQNLFDAVLLGTRRIGHGFSLYKHPLLIDMVKDKRILVESCPISNEVLRLTHSIMSHPLPALLARGVPVALCNDDPTMLGHVTNGLTNDFWQALQGWDNLGLEGLASMAENSVRWASFDDLTTAEWQKELKDGAFGQGERAQRMKEWAKDWEDFCAWIVKEYGP